MIINKLKIQGFKSFTKEQVLDFNTIDTGVTFVTGINNVEPKLGANGCLIGDTEIDFPRNLLKNISGVKIKDLVGKEFYTYCFDTQTNSLKLKKAFNIRKTGVKKEVWKVLFKGQKRKGFKNYDNLIATPEHLFLKSNGSYCALKNLKPGDSLMSFYRRNYDGYSHIRATLGKEFYEHKLITKELFNLETGDVGHHVDHIKLNNSIGNLKPMSIKEHAVYHAKYGNKIGFFQWKEHPRGMLGKLHSENTKNKISSTLKYKYENNMLSKEAIIRPLREWYAKKVKEYPWNDKELLEYLYNTKLLSVADIVKDYFNNECSDVTVYNFMKKFDIKRRNLSDAQILYRRQKNNHKVLGIEFYGYEDVYDMEVEDTHNFVANGVIVHNSGKSSIFGALCFAFFGKTAENLKAGDIANWSKDEKCVVIVEFEQKKILYTLTRKWNPNSLELEAIHPEGFSTSKTVTQEDVEKVIGMNFESFLYSVFISQFGKKFIDFTPSEKMEVFSEIMDDVLKKWDGYGEKAKKLRDEKEKLIVESEKDIANLEGQIKSINVEDLKAKIYLWENSNKELIVIKNKELDGLVNKKRPDITSYNKELEERKHKLGEIKKELKSSETLLLEVNKYVLETKTILYSNKNDEDRLKRGIKKYSDVLSEKVCSRCGQEITEKHIKKEIDSLIKEIEALAQHTKIILEKNRVNLIKQNEVGDEIGNLKEEIEVETGDIHNLETLIKEEEMWQKSLIKEIGVLKTEIEKMKQEINPYAILYEENKDKFNVLKRQLLYKKEGLQNIVKDFEIYKYWIKGFKDIKLLLTEDALKEFEIEINNNLTKLGLSEDWSIKLRINSENKSGSIKKGFSVLIISPLNNSPVPFECYSGGESQRIRLAFTMGLVDFIKNRRGVRSNILILDEPTHFLSEGGIEDLIDFLREKAKEDNLKIFLIDHRNLNTYGQFSNIFIVVKDLNGSRIE